MAKIEFRTVAYKVIPDIFYQLARSYVVAKERKASAMNGIEINAEAANITVNDFQVPNASYLEIARRYLEQKKAQIFVSEPYKAGADWEKILDATWKDFKDAAKEERVQDLKAFFQNFFRHRVIEGFWGGTAQSLREPRRLNMFIKQYMAWFEHFGEKARTILPDLDAPKIGNPWGFRVNDSLIYEPAFEYHLQATVFKNLLKDIKNPVILEIGGGFGGLAYFIKKLIPDAVYIGIDLPENIALQNFYLSCAYPNSKIEDKLEVLGDKNSLMKSEVDFAFLPNYQIKEVPDKCIDLVINVRSFSEMPLNTISEYFTQVERIASAFVYHENIYKRRSGHLHGIPTSEFPPLSNFNCVFESVSRWPRYNADSGYPCKEYLYLHRAAMTNYRNESTTNYSSSV